MKAACSAVRNVAPRKYQSPRKRQALNTSYRSTKVEKEKLEPATMQIRPRLKLCEACAINGYSLSIDDFDPAKVFLDKGAFSRGKDFRNMLHALCKFSIPY